MADNEFEEDELIRVATEERDAEKDLIIGRSPADASLFSEETGAGATVDPQFVNNQPVTTQNRVIEGFDPTMLARPEEDILNAPLVPEPSQIITTDPITLEGTYKKKAPKAIMAKPQDFTEVVPEPDLMTERAKIAPIIEGAKKHQDALDAQVEQKKMEAADLEIGAQQNKLDVVKDLHDQEQKLRADKNNYIKTRMNDDKKRSIAEVDAIPKKEKNRTSLMIAGFLSGLGAGLQGKQDDFGSWLNSRLTAEAKKSAILRKGISDRYKRDTKVTDVKSKDLDKQIDRIITRRYKEIDIELARNQAKAKSPAMQAKIGEARVSAANKYTESMIKQVKYQIQGFEDMQKSRFKEGSVVGVIPRKGGKIKDQATRDRTVMWNGDRVVLKGKKEREKMDKLLPAITDASGLMFNMLAIIKDIGPFEVTQDTWLKGTGAARYKAYQKQLLGKVGQAIKDGGLGIYPAGVLQEWDLKAMGDIATTGIGVHSKRILQDLLQNTSSSYGNAWSGMGISKGELPPGMRFKSLTREAAKKARKNVER